MNINAIIAFVIATAVLFLGFRLASEDLTLFVDYPSLFIVLGGTFASTAISFQLTRFFSLVQIFLNKMLKGRSYKMNSIIRELMILADGYRKGESFKQLKDKTEDFFLKEGFTLLEDGVLTIDEAFEVLVKRNGQISFNYMEDANRIRTIGKYPPAFGMIGTVIGMIVLLANLGGEDAMKMIGPAMGVCLITTLYGSVLANLFFIPVADYLTENAKEVALKNKIILEGLRLITVKSNPIVVAERLNSFLNPGERLDWKEVMGK